MRPTRKKTRAAPTRVPIISGRRSLSSLRCIWNACQSCVLRSLEACLRAAFAAAFASLVGLPLPDLLPFAMYPGYVHCCAPLLTARG